MKNLYFLLMLFLLFASQAGAQVEERAIGIRGGISSGIEYRAFSDEELSYRLLLSARHHGLQLTGLKEFHRYGLFDWCDQLVFVYGFGAHLGYEKWMAYRPGPEGPDYWKHRTGVVAGLDGLAALEYRFWKIPLTIGLDAKPYFNFFGRNFCQVQPFDIGLTIRYVF